MTAVKTINVDGAVVEITLNEKGEFLAKVETQWITAPTMKGIEERVRKAVRSAGKLSIEATLLDFGFNDDEPSFEDILITGQHASNNNVLYRDDSGAVQQLRTFNSDCMIRLSKDQRKEFGELVKARKRAEKAMEKWKADHKLDAHQAIRKARGLKADEEL